MLQLQHPGLWLRNKDSDIIELEWVAFKISVLVWVPQKYGTLVKRTLLAAKPETLNPETLNPRKPKNAEHNPKSLEP